MQDPCHSAFCLGVQGCRWRRRLRKGLASPPIPVRGLRPGGGVAPDSCWLRPHLHVSLGLNEKKNLELTGIDSQFSRPFFFFLSYARKKEQNSWNLFKELQKHILRSITISTQSPVLFSGQWELGSRMFSLRSSLTLKLSEKR